MTRDSMTKYLLRETRYTVDELNQLDDATLHQWYIEEVETNKGVEVKSVPAMTKALSFIISELNNSTEGWHTLLCQDDMDRLGITKEEFDAAIDALYDIDAICSLDDDLCSLDDEEDCYNGYYINIFTDFAYRLDEYFEKGEIL